MSESRWRGRWLALEHHSLAAAQAMTLTAHPRDEAVLVLVAGAVRWCNTSAHRANGFDDRASAVYVPPGVATTVEALEPTRLIEITTVTGDLEPTMNDAIVVDPADVTVEHRGEPGYRRDVHDIVGTRIPAQRLLVGETFNEPGEWSSFPPHKHDGRDGEPPLEEVYAFRFDRPDGFGFIGFYGRADGRADDAVLLRDGDVVGFGSGYHPVSAAPGCRLAYLWALAGPERRLVMVDDPAHARPKS